MNLENITDLLRAGKTISFPTETVYAVGCNGFCDKAVKTLYRVKNREASQPMQIMVSSLKEAQSVAQFTRQALELADKYWPGALTMILPERAGSGLSKYININDNNIAIRFPDHKLAQDIIRALGNPLATSSANKSGGKTAISSHDVAKIFGENNLGAIIEGEIFASNEASTIIDLSDANEVKIIRQGSLKIYTA